MASLQTQGRDSPTSTIIVFSSSRVFHWKSSSLQQRLVNLTLATDERSRSSWQPRWLRSLTCQTIANHSLDRKFETHCDHQKLSFLFLVAHGLRTTIYVGSYPRETVKSIPENWHMVINSHGGICSHMNKVPTLMFPTPMLKQLRYPSHQALCCESSN